MIEPLRARQHHARLRLAGQEHAIDVDVVDFFPGFERHRFSGFGACNAGIVDGDRERSKLGFNAFDGAAEIGPGRHRPCQHQRPAPERRDPLCRLLQPAFRGMAEAGDVRSRLGKPDRYCLPDPAARAGDERHLAIQFEQVHPKSSR